MTVAIGDSIEELDYQIGTSCPHLAGFYVFDSTAVRVHMSRSNAISFSPAGLDALRRLAEITDEVRVLLNEEILQRGKLRDFSVHFVGDSPVKTFVDALGPSTDLDDLRRLASMSDAESDMLASLDQEIAKLKLLNISEQIQQVKQAAKDFDDLVLLLDQIDEYLRPEGLETLAAILDERNRWQSAVHETGLEQFRVGGLTQTGSDVWYRFLQAARALAAAESGDGAPYPQAGSRCLLCHQPLGSEAHALVHHLWDFLRNEAQNNLERTSHGVDAWRRKLTELDLEIFTPRSALYRTVAGADPTLAQSVEQYLAACQGVRQRAVAAETRQELAPGTELPNSGTLQLRTKIDALDMRVADLEAENPAERIRELEERLRYLQHRARLSELHPQIEAYLRDQQWVARASRSGGSTGHITRQYNKMFDALVTKRYVKLFEKTLEGLGRPFRVQVKTSGRKGDVVKQIVVTADRSHSAKTTAPENVLSEGEKRVVALADFLTEVALDTESNGVVLDDPVTSLDVEWRQVIAGMLAREATSKQVIVFTHDMPFLYYLKQSAESRQVDLRTHWIRRGDQDDRPGYVYLDNSPALEKDYRSSKIAWECHKRAKDAAPGDQIRHLRDGFGALRTSYEAFIIFQMLNEVVVRWGERISFGRLTGIVWDQALAAEVNESCERLSRYIEGHSHSDAFAGGGPSLQALVDEITAFRRAAQPAQGVDEALFRLIDALELRLPGHCLSRLRRSSSDHLTRVGDVVGFQREEHLVADVIGVGDAAGLLVDGALEEVAGEARVAEDFVTQAVGRLEDADRLLAGGRGQHIVVLTGEVLQDVGEFLRASSPRIR